MQNGRDWWLQTRLLMVTCLLALAFFGFAVHLLADALNGIVILGFPLGFYMAAQGSLIAFVVLIFRFAARQDRIDRNFSVAEDD